MLEEDPIYDVVKKRDEIKDVTFGDEGHSFKKNSLLLSNQSDLYKSENVLADQCIIQTTKQIIIIVHYDLG